MFRFRREPDQAPAAYLNKSMHARITLVALHPLGTIYPHGDLKRFAARQISAVASSYQRLRSLPQDFLLPKGSLDFMIHKFSNCIILCLIIMFIGCSEPVQNNSVNANQNESDAEKNLIGRWSPDVDASKAKWGDHIELARRMSHQLDVEWEFKSDNKFAVYKGERSITGNWMTKSKDEKQILVEIDSDADPTDKRVILTFVFENRDRVIYSSDEAEGELVLVRNQN